MTEISRGYRIDEWKDDAWSHCLFGAREMSNKKEALNIWQVYFVRISRKARLVEVKTTEEVIAEEPCTEPVKEWL